MIGILAKADCVGKYVPRDGPLTLLGGFVQPEQIGRKPRLTWVDHTEAFSRTRLNSAADVSDAYSLSPRGTTNPFHRGLSRNCRAMVDMLIGLDHNPGPWWGPGVPAGICGPGMVWLSVK